MIQKFIYKKDITREINGVIKADSTFALSEEITEYVITAEQIRLLPRLFDSLVPPHKANCVWFSGDFGSGKSHLLKILSYVLENKKEEKFIGNLKAMYADIENAYNNSFKSINKWIEEETNKRTPFTTEDNPNSHPQKEEVSKRQTKLFVRKAVAVDVQFSKPILETEDDVEAYIREVKKKMMDYIHQNKNIMLN